MTPLLSEPVLRAAFDLSIVAPQQWAAFVTAFEHMCGDYSRRAMEVSIQDMQVVHGRAQGLLAVERDLVELNKHIAELNKIESNKRGR